MWVHEYMGTRLHVYTREQREEEYERYREEEEERRREDLEERRARKSNTI